MYFINPMIIWLSQQKVQEGNENHELILIF